MQELPPLRLWVCAALCWLSNREILLQRRSPGAKHGANTWELVGGKVERGESSQAALARELGEEWGPVGSTLPILGVAEILHHCYPPPGPEVHLLVFHVDGRSLAQNRWAQQLRPMPGVKLGAFELGSLPLHECIAADRDFLANLTPFDFSLERSTFC